MYTKWIALTDCLDSDLYPLTIGVSNQLISNAVKISFGDAFGPYLSKHSYGQYLLSLRNDTL